MLASLQSLSFSLRSAQTEVSDISTLGRVSVTFRDLTKSDILWETNDYLVRVAWNKNNKHHVAVISMNDNSVALLDVRHQMGPLAKLTFHKAPVNHLAWAPHSAYVRLT
jgi:WD40 repeat protein